MTRSILEMKILRPSPAFENFRRETGLAAFQPSEVRVLEDPQDTAICRRLNGIYAEEIAATQEQRGAHVKADAPENEVTYYQAGKYYVAVIGTAQPVPAEPKPGWALVSTGGLSRVTIYDGILISIWSAAWH